jgi:hypothetical protein
MAILNARLSSKLSFFSAGFVCMSVLSVIVFYQF